MSENYELTDLGATEYGALVRDARRYRWLRDEAFVAEAGRVVQMLPGAMDAAIDAAMEAAK